MSTAPSAWRSLTQHAELARAAHMHDWSAAPNTEERVRILTLDATSLTVDYSKNRLTPKILALPLQLIDEADMFTLCGATLYGDRTNNIKHRSVLHVALCGRVEGDYRADGEPIMSEMLGVWAQVHDFANCVHSDTQTGCSEKCTADVVNVGIDGPDLGPRMIYRALDHLAMPQMCVHSVSNVDGTDLAETLDCLDPDTTLAIVYSKTFIMLETMTNTHSIRHWFVEHGVAEARLRHHFVAVSTNRKIVVQSGIDPDNTFTFWDWVNGRFSLQSTMGLSIVLATGPRQFEAMLDGTYTVDHHFTMVVPRENLPLIFGMLSVWYRGLFDTTSACTVPYYASLKLLTDSIQQLEMESNGGPVQRNNMTVDTNIGPIAQGTTDTSGQHAYLQLVRRNSQAVPVDSIATPEPVHTLPGRRAELLADCFAQNEALLLRRTAEEIHMGGVTDEALVPHMVFGGNRPSTTILMEKLDAVSLDALIVCAEHRVFVQGAVWNINSFGQWGVGPGRELTKPI